MASSVRKTVSGKAKSTAHGSAVVTRSARGSVVSRTAFAGNVSNYADVYDLDLVGRVKKVKRGIPSGAVSQMATDMGVPQKRVQDVLRLASSSMTRRKRTDQPLSVDESERVLRLQSLIGLAQKLVMQFGDPEGFNAAKWVADWMDQPLPALGGERPSVYLDTDAGARLVEDTLMSMVTGVAA